MLIIMSKFRVCHQSLVMTYTNLLQHYPCVHAEAVHSETQSWVCTNPEIRMCTEIGGIPRKPWFGQSDPGNPSLGSYSQSGGQTLEIGGVP
jgi:hypothetical protein